MVLDRALVACVAAAALALTGCGSDDGPVKAVEEAALASPPAAAPTLEPPPVSSSFVQLAELPLTAEVTAYSGPALSLPDYQQQVNQRCRGLQTWVMDNPPPDEADGDAVVAAYAVELLTLSGSTYTDIAALRPPPEREADVRSGFLGPYFRQLNAAERLYTEHIARGKQTGVDEVLAEATAAKRDLTVYAAKNDLTDCIG